MRSGSAMASPHSSAANGPWAAGDLQRLQRPVGGLTMASALQQQPPQLAQPSPLPGTDASQQKTSSGEPSAAMMALAKPMFRKTRSSETAEAAFEHAIAAHRAIFSDDISFVDGTPLLQSLAPSWPRLSAKHRPRRADASDSNADADADAGADDSEAKTAVGVAAGAMVRDFNASLRMWREDNGSTWIDPHTGIRQIPESLQPTAVQAERIDGSHGSAKIRTTIVDRLVSFVEDELPTSRDGVAALPGDYPLALLPGQYQHEFPVHQTRFGQTYEQAVTLYQYHWSRQLAVQQQMQMQQQQQLQRQQQQQQQQQNQQRQPPK
ncbi:hypothetical protein FBU59_004159 [Linderina macrospora]|uniref:Uncharacterized protein n=1 Tax=Linderina macrospora TaxID=4868 RepID=A0ACC1J688_9FUNG|nr:hypothetical protein FBU59_004159 [Linderina macrospora]